MGRGKRKKRVTPSEALAGPDEPLALALEPLSCARCGGAVAVSDSPSVRCAFCDGAVVVPEAYRMLRESELALQGTRDRARELYRRLGRPPGVFLRVWASAAEIAGTALIGVIALFLYIGGSAALLALFALELLLHALARNGGRDWIDIYGGGGAHARVGISIALGLVLPVALSAYLARFAALRRELKRSLAAKPPSAPGGPSQCRLCGAALDVPAKALGVRCMYCRADNLVALPARWVASTRKASASVQRAIEDVFARAQDVARSARNELVETAIACAIAIPVLWALGEVAVWLDSEVPAPSWDASMGDPRRMLSILPRSEAAPLLLGRPGEITFHEGGREKTCARSYYAALQTGERLSLRSRSLNARSSIRVKNTTTFPFLELSEDCGWTPRSDGSFGCIFQAPYTGYFRFDIEAHASRCRERNDLTASFAPLAPEGVPALEGVRARALFKHGKGVEQVLFSPDGLLIASAGDDGGVRVFRREDAAIVLSLEGIGERAIAIAFSPDGRRLAVGSSDRRVRVYDIGAGKLESDLEAHEDRVLAVAFSGDGRWLATGGRDRTVKMWAVAPGGLTLAATLTGHTDAVSAVAFSPSSERLASGSYDERVRIWSVSERSTLATLEDSGPVLALSYGRTYLASAPKHRVATLWSTIDRPSYHDGLAGQEREVLGVALAEDESVVVAGGLDRVIRFFDPRTSAIRAALGGVSSAIQTLALSHDRGALAAGLADGSVLVWDREDRSPLVP